MCYLAETNRPLTFLKLRDLLDFKFFPELVYRTSSYTNEKKGVGIAARGAADLNQILLSITKRFG